MEHAVEIDDIVAVVETADTAVAVGSGLGVEDSTDSVDDDDVEGSAEASFALWAAARSRSFC